MPVNATQDADEILDGFLGKIGAAEALAADPLYAAQARSFRDWLRTLSVVLHDEGLGSAKRSIILRRACYAMRGPAEAEERLAALAETDGRIGRLRQMIVAAVQGHPWRPAESVVEATIVCGVGGCPNGPEEHAWDEASCV
jgi:hypothetical protein